MTLIKYKPSSSFIPSAFSEFFEQDFSKNFFRDDVSLPAVNISENENSHLIEVSAAGFEKDQFNIEVEDNKLTISAEVKHKKEEKTDKNNKEKTFYTRREFNFSSFQRSFTLPKNVDAENIEAAYENGILKLTLPKKVEVINRKKVAIS